MKTKTSSGIKVTAAIKAGGMNGNHARSGLKVKAGIKAGSIMRRNHNMSCLATS